VRATCNLKSNAQAMFLVSSQLTTDKDVRRSQSGQRRFWRRTWLRKSPAKCELFDISDRFMIGEVRVPLKELAESRQRPVVAAAPDLPYQQP